MAAPTRPGQSPTQPPDTRVAGTTIVIVVAGMAPQATVPSFRRGDCADAVNRIIDAGLYPEYLSDARTGTAQLAPHQINLHWNDTLRPTW